jgi:glycosyltransferase involved in cell wall biosynthesis
LSFDFIILSSSRWDKPYSSTILSIAREVSKHHRVFVIDNPFTWTDYFRGKRSEPILKRKEALLKGKNNYRVLTENQLIAVTPRLMIPINWLPKGLIYNALARVNELVFSRCLKKLLHDYAIENYVYINSFLPFYFKEFPPFFRPELFLYQSVDDIAHSKYLGKHGRYLEDRMIRKADITLVTSTYLYKRKEKLANAIYIIPNAADVALFRTASQQELPIPAELAGETRKVIIYVGNTVTERTDVSILNNLAVTHPNKLLLFVGPYDKEFLKESGLQDFSNVRFLGPRPTQDIPAYLQYAHCAIIPFLRNMLTKSIYPLKINEYLSAGKPVVSTAFSDDIVAFSNIYIANTPSDFSRSVNIAINEDSAHKQQLRVAEAEPNSWKDRAARLLKVVAKARENSANRPDG